MIKSISNLNLRGKEVLLRLDLNSPVVEGKIIDNPRLKESSQTIAFLLNKKAKVIIIAHQGRKEGKDFLSLKQHAHLLSKHLNKEIKYVDYLFEEVAINEINNLKDGTAILLKNVRNYEDEGGINLPKNRYLSFCKNFNLFVNDAFSVCHRKQGSIIIPPKVIPSYVGPNLEKEISVLKKFHLGNKKTIYILGGEKVEDYLPIFNNLKNKNNKILASGVLANLLLISKGIDFGYENEWMKQQHHLLLLPKLKILYKKYKNQILLPIDFAIESNNRRVELHLSSFPVNSKIRDVGHETVRIFKSEIRKARAAFMKGPLGFSEMKNFKYATVEILKEVSLLSKKKKIFSLLGGGHLTTSIDEYKIPNNFSHISLSGGALIAYISEEKLPGLEALDESHKSAFGATHKLKEFSYNKRAIAHTL